MVFPSDKALIDDRVPVEVAGEKKYGPDGRRVSPCASPGPRRFPPYGRALNLMLKYGNIPDFVFVTTGHQAWDEARAINQRQSGTGSSDDATIIWRGSFRDVWNTHV